MNNKEIVVLVDCYVLTNINPNINKLLPYMVDKEMRDMLPHITMVNRGNIDIDKHYSQYLTDMCDDERIAYDKFIKHVYTMLLYSTTKLDGMLDCVYKQKHNYIVLHLKERV